MTKIQKTIDDLNAANQLVSELSHTLTKHFQPIINKAVKAKDRDKLESLLDVLPECMTKFAVYHGLRIIREK
jgi:hypothetical protein